MHKLEKWLKNNGVTQQELAKRVGYPQSCLSRAMRGKIMPGRDVIKRIKQETNGEVDFADWFTDDEKKEGPAASVAPFLMMDNLVSACG